MIRVRRTCICNQQIFCNYILQENDFMKNFKKIISLVLCLALLFGTAALGVTAYAEEAGEPATATDAEAEPDPGIADLVESVEFPEDFYTFYMPVFMLDQLGYHAEKYPSFITLNMTDGTKITVEDKISKETVTTSTFSGDFNLDGEDSTHTVYAHYTHLDETERINFVVYVDSTRVYIEEVQDVISVLPLDLWALQVYVFGILLLSKESVTNKFKAIIDIFKSFFEFRKIIRENKYQDYLFIPVQFAAAYKETFNNIDFANQ